MSTIDHGWRRFNFFTKMPVLDPVQPQQLLHLKLNVTICVNTENYTLLAGEDGAVLKITQAFNCKVWNAFERRPKALQADGNLVFGMEENDGNSAQLKIWDIGEQWERAAPRCLLNARIAQAKKSGLNGATVAAVAINKRHTVIAIGFSDSSVLYYDGDFSATKPILPKCRTLRDGAGALGCGALCGLVVADSPAGDPSVIIFVITETLLTSYLIDSDCSVLRTITYDDCSGCQRDAWHFNPTTQQLIIAGNEVVNMYDVANCIEAGEERGRCYALARGYRKRQTIACKDYVALVVDKISTTDASKHLSDSSDQLLFIYDVEFRYMGFQCSLPTDSFVFSHCGEIVILDRSTGTLVRLAAVPISQKEEYLLKRNLFDVAIGLARRSNSDSLYRLYELHGDYMYSRGDYENSIRQYIETIGHLEASNVIQKFMNGTLVPQLCTYLEAIHQRGYVDPYRTGLLIATYTKLRDEQRIVKFIDQSTEFHNFDVENVVKNLHAAKFVKLAARLAALHRRGGAFMRLLVEDLREYRNAVEYLKRIPFEEACRLIDTYADVLLENEEGAVWALVSKLILENKNGLISKPLLNIVLRRPDHLNEALCKCILQCGDVSTRNAVLQRLLQTINDQNEKGREELIFSLVDDKNLSRALYLGQLYDFPPLIYYVLSRQNRHHDLLQFMLNGSNIEDIIERCGEDALANSWIDVISRKHIDTEQMFILLNKTAEWNFVQPLEILRILARNNDVKFGDVKVYIHEWFKKQNEWVINKEAKISENAQKVSEYTQLIKDIKYNVQRFQANRCTVCGQALSSATVHYLCQHAYHVACDDNGRCFVCQRNNNSHLDSRHSDLPQNLEDFREKLNTSSDQISVIADYIDQGILDLNVN